MRTAFFWDVDAGSSSNSLVIHYQSFGTNYRFHIQGSRELPILAA